MVFTLWSENENCLKLNFERAIRIEIRSQLEIFCKLSIYYCLNNSLKIRNSKIVQFSYEKLEIIETA